MTRPHRQAGFTLIEIMVSVAILSIVTVLVAGSFAHTANLKRQIEAIQDRTSQVRMAMGRLTRDLSMAYFSNHEDPTIADKRTQFVSRSRGGGISELTFSYMGHMRLYKDAAESDTANVMYYGEADPNDRRRMNLMRRETRRLQAGDPRQQPGEAYIVCEDVVRFKLSFYDRQLKEWRDEWSTLSADGQQYLPWRIRIQLVIRDERGVEIPFMTETKTMLAEQIGWSER